MNQLVAAIEELDRVLKNVDDAQSDYLDILRAAGEHVVDCATAERGWVFCTRCDARTAVLTHGICWHCQQAERARQRLDPSPEEACPCSFEWLSFAPTVTATIATCGACGQKWDVSGGRVERCAAAEATARV